LTTKQRRELVVKILKRHDDWGPELIASVVGGGIHRQTVDAARERLEAAREIHNLDKLKGKDGKYHPRRRRRSLAELDKLVSEPGRCRDCGDEFALKDLHHETCVVCAASILFKLAGPVEHDGKRLRAIIAAPPLKPRETDWPEELREPNPGDREEDGGGVVLLADSEASLSAFLTDFHQLDREIAKMGALLDQTDINKDEMCKALRRIKRGRSWMDLELTV
jgi:predicted Zn-ribbon and HTH transcriptional regulator